MKKQIISLLLSFALLMSLFPLTLTGGSQNRVYATTNGHSQAEAVAWARAQIGKSFDYFKDKYPYQCADFIPYYFDYLGHLEVVTKMATHSGKDYASVSYLPSGWKKIPYSSGFVAQPGDIAIWNWTRYKENGEIKINPDGHVAIVTSADASSLTFVNQNWDGLYVSENNVSYSWAGFYGVIRPNFFDFSEDIGTGFYAYIVKKDSWIHLENFTKNGGAKGNLQLAADNDKYDPKQIWLFNRQDDGSYEIKNAYDDSCIDAEFAGSVNETNIITYPANGTNAQRWYILKNGLGFSIKSSYCDLYMDVYKGGDDPGTNIQLYEKNNTSAQCFAICRLDSDGISYSKPDKPDAPVLTVEAGINESTETILCWTESPLKDPNFDLRHYDLRVYNEDNELIETIYEIKENSYAIELSEGLYSAKITAVNKKYSNWYTHSNTVTFSIDESPCKNGNHSFDDGIVTTEATCTNTGIRTYTCSVCGGTKTESIPAFGHAYVITARTPGNCIQPDSVVYTCSRCGNTYSDEGGKWTDWSTTAPPSDAYKSERKTQYRYSDRKTTSTSDSSLSGWTLVGKTYSDWSAWSDWSTTEVSSTETRDVEQAKLYRYYCYKCSNCGMRDPYKGSCSSCGRSSLEWASRLSTVPYSECNYSTFGKPYTTILGDGLRWYFSIGNLNDTAVGTKDADSDATVIFWGYRSRTRTITYNYERWTEYSEWSDIEYTASSNRKVETRTLYRYVAEAPVLGEHTWDAGSVTTPASCTAPGVKTYTCSLCGEKKTDTIPALGHQEKTVPGREATCTEAGLTNGVVCERCGEVLTAQETIPALGHQEKNVPGREATCTEAGLTNGVVCERCNEVLTAQETIPALGHQEKNVPGREATCTEAGFSNGVVCERCGEILTAQETVPALGHDWSAWVKLDETYHQRVCGRNASHVETAAHEWDDGVRVSGGTKYTCATCSATRTVEDPTPVETDLDIEVASVKTQAGETVTLDVYITKAAPVNYLRLTPTYDKTALTLTEVKNGDLFDTLEKGTSFLFNAESDVNATGLLATLTFTVAEGAEAGDYEIGLSVKEAWDYNEDLLHVGVTPGVITVRDFIYGDVNGDGVIDGRDLVRLRKYLANLDETTGVSAVEIFPGADCTGDGTVDGRDLIRLRKYLANYDEETGTSPIVLGP